MKLHDIFENTDIEEEAVNMPLGFEKYSTKNVSYTVTPFNGSMEDGDKINSIYLQNCRAYKLQPARPLCDYSSVENTLVLVTGKDNGSRVCFEFVIPQTTLDSFEYASEKGLPEDELKDMIGTELHQHYIYVQSLAVHYICDYVMKVHDISNDEREENNINSVDVSDFISSTIAKLQMNNDPHAMMGEAIEELDVDDETVVALMDIIDECTMNRFNLNTNILTLTEGAKQIWRRKGDKVVRGYRCTSGKKKGRIVSSAAECSGSVDLKKRQRMKKLLSQKGARLRKKAQKTKKRKPASIRVQKLNKNK